LGSAEAGELLTPEQIITGFGEGKKKNNLRIHEEVAYCLREEASDT